jgi:hypothetical protein
VGFGEQPKMGNIYMGCSGHTSATDMLQIQIAILKI